jgi:hypothetical protein
MMNNFDPSQAPNGDFVQEVGYTHNDEHIVVMHKHTDNLYLYDPESFEVEQIIDLGRGPLDMKITEN